MLFRRIRCEVEAYVLVYVTIRLARVLLVLSQLRRPVISPVASLHYRRPPPPPRQTHGEHQAFTGQPPPFIACRKTSGSIYNSPSTFAYHPSRCVMALYQPGILQQPLTAPFRLDDGKVGQEPWPDGAEPVLCARREGTPGGVHPHGLLQGQTLVRQERRHIPASVSASASASAAFGFVRNTVKAVIAWLSLRFCGVTDVEWCRWRGRLVRPEHRVVHASKRVVGLRSKPRGTQGGEEALCRREEGSREF